LERKAATFFERASNVVNLTPHTAALGMRVVEATEGSLVMELPYREAIVGNPVSGVIHGGALTTLADMSCAIASQLSPGAGQPGPTLDLRIDYMTRARPSESLFCRASIVRSTRHVSYTQAEVYQDAAERTVARAVACTMHLDDDAPGINTPGLPLPEVPAPAPFHLAVDRGPQGEIPYARLLGIALAVDQGENVFVLEPRRDNVGNLFLPALHGGAVGGFMESAAIFHLQRSLQTTTLPRVVNFSIDYLRPVALEPSYAACEIVRQGRKIANVAITVWQGDRNRPLATARSHFLLG
jgi:uncharacterized protein (TIGR00369 family)